MAWDWDYVVEPGAGQPVLGPAEAAARIGAAFAVCEISREKGRQAAGRRLAALQKLGAPEAIRKQQRAIGEHAIHCAICDEARPANRVEFLLWPEEPIAVRFASEHQRAEGLALLDRLARALGYQVRASREGR